MKIVSYNVNGIRSSLTKGLDKFLMEHQPDVVCLQEIKAQAAQIPQYLFDVMGYHYYWHPAQKLGYSGVGILSKRPADKVVVGCDMPNIDCEGRVLRPILAI